MNIKSIADITKEVGKFATVRYNPTYPVEDLCIAVTLKALPFKIERGLDRFFFNGGKTRSDRHLWYVSRDDYEYPPLYIAKGFVDIRDAIDAALKKYKKESLKAIKAVDSIREKLIIQRM